MLIANFPPASEAVAPVASPAVTHLVASRLVPSKVSENWEVEAALGLLAGAVGATGSA